MEEALAFLQESWRRRQGPSVQKGLYFPNVAAFASAPGHSVLKPGAGLKPQFYWVALPIAPGSLLSTHPLQHF